MQTPDLRDLRHSARHERSHWLPRARRGELQRCIDLQDEPGIRTPRLRLPVDDDDVLSAIETPRSELHRLAVPDHECPLLIRGFAVPGVDVQVPPYARGE